MKVTITAVIWSSSLQVDFVGLTQLRKLCRKRATVTVCGVNKEKVRAYM